MVNNPFKVGDLITPDPESWRNKESGLDSYSLRYGNVYEVTIISGEYVAIRGISGMAYWHRFKKAEKKKLEYKVTKIVIGRK